jgi:amino acid transporter
VALGIGAVIGAGIFVLTGHAAATHAGPAVVLSFVIAGFACGLAGLCYAEFASMLPVSGSAYSYAYATLGELVGLVHRLDARARIHVCRRDGVGRLVRIFYRPAGLHRSRPRYVACAAGCTHVSAAERR